MFRMAIVRCINDLNNNDNNELIVDCLQVS